MGLGWDDLMTTDTLIGGLGGALTTGMATGFNPYAMGAGALGGGYMGAKKHDAGQRVDAATQNQQDMIGQAREMLNANKAAQYRQRILDTNKALSMFDPTNQLYKQMHGGPMHGGRLDVPAGPAAPAPPGAEGAWRLGGIPEGATQAYEKGKAPGGGTPVVRGPSAPARSSLSAPMPPQAGVPTMGPTMSNPTGAPVVLTGPNQANPMDPNDPRRGMGYVPPPDYNSPNRRFG